MANDDKPFPLLPLPLPMPSMVWVRPQSPPPPPLMAWVPPQSPPSPPPDPVADDDNPSQPPMLPQHKLRLKRRAQELLPHESESSQLRLKGPRQADEREFAAPVSPGSSISEELELEARNFQHCINECKLYKHFLLDRISENQAELESVTEKLQPKVTACERLLDFVNKLENAHQYFEFKKLVYEIPLSYDGTSDLMDTCVNMLGTEVQEKFDKLSKEDRECAIRARLNDFNIDQTPKRRSILIQRFKKDPLFMRQQTYTEHTTEEEIARMEEIFPALRLEKPEVMDKYRRDAHVSRNPILKLVEQVRQGCYVMDENPEVELQKLESNLIGKSLDGPKKRVPTRLEDLHAISIHFIVCMVSDLEATISSLEHKKVESQRKADEIKKMHQLSLNPPRALQLVEDPDGIITKAVDKYKELLKDIGKI